MNDRMSDMDALVEKAARVLRDEVIDPPRAGDRGLHQSSGLWRRPDLRAVRPSPTTRDRGPRRTRRIGDTVMGAMKARVVAAREAADEARREDDKLLTDVAWDEISGGTDNPMERR